MRALACAMLQCGAAGLLTVGVPPMRASLAVTPRSERTRLHMRMGSSSEADFYRALSSLLAGSEEFRQMSDGERLDKMTAVLGGRELAPLLESLADRRFFSSREVSATDLPLSLSPSLSCPHL